jgi:protein-tyrosine phosphatase
LSTVSRQKMHTSHSITCILPSFLSETLLNVGSIFVQQLLTDLAISTFNLTILDCIRGLAKAISHKFLNYDTFNAEEYFHYEKVENGDMNWILPGKFLAFSSPASRRITPDGMIHLTPDDYYPIFKKWNVTAVVRLNKKLYDRRQFTNYNINHYDMYYIDGGLPPEPILTKFLEIAQSEKGGIAVHCKAGLGRTGTLIGMYLMKHHHFTASDVVAWLRVVRPGSVIGIQQHYLKDMQARMWKQGEQIFQQLLSTNPSMAQQLNALEISARTPTTPTTPTSPSTLGSPSNGLLHQSSSPLFSSRTMGSPSSGNVSIPSPINTTKFMAPSSPTNNSLRVPQMQSKSLSPYQGTDSPTRTVSASSGYTRPQRSNRPMTTTGLSRAIPVLTQTLQSSSITDSPTSPSSPVSNNTFGKRLVSSANTLDQPDDYHQTRPSYARDTNSITINPHLHSIMNNSNSLTPTSLRSSNMSGGSNSSLFGNKNTSVVSSKPIKKLHHLTEMNNKYVPQRQAKSNFLLHGESDALPQYNAKPYRPN